jgi:hypothetical protein
MSAYRKMLDLTNSLVIEKGIYFSAMKIFRELAHQDAAWPIPDVGKAA